MTGIRVLLFAAVAFMMAATAFSEGEENAALAMAANEFSVDLLKRAAKDGNENVLMSPLSIATILSMLHQGAGGGTAEQLQKVLRATADESKAIYTKALKGLESKNEHVELEWGNGVYLKPGFELSENFRKAMHEDFRSDVQELNFTQPSKEAAAAEINEWISNVTHGHIGELVDPSLLSENTVMVLVNGIYFKGTWSMPFDSNMTVNEDFEIEPNKTVNVPFMRKEKDGTAGEDEELGVKWVELPYRGYDFSLVLVLPTERHGLGKVLDKMTGADLRRIISSNDRRHVHLKLPKFKVSKKVSLVDTLSQMGVPDLFSTNANLDGITASGKKGLQVSEIVHQADMEVDEEGTTASAATAGFIQVLSLLVPPENLFFTADEPFLAFIVDRNSDVPIFSAMICDPSS